MTYVLLFYPIFNEDQKQTFITETLSQFFIQNQKQMTLKLQQFCMFAVVWNLLGLEQCVFYIFENKF